MAIKNSQAADLIMLTLNDLPKQYFEVTWDSQDYEACRIYQQDRMVIDGGEQIQRHVMLNDTGNARYRRMYDIDQPNVQDVMHKILVPWCQLSTHYSWDKVEIARQMNSAKGFISLMKERRIDGLWSLAKLIEDRFWKTPASATDDLYPYGVPYYIRWMNQDSTTDGFVGQTIRYQDGNAGTTCANIDSSAEARWRNYAALYTTIDNAMLRKFRLAFLYTNFKAPLIVNDPSKPVNGAKRIYTTFDNVVDLQDLADAKDDKHTGKEVLGNLRMDDTGLVYVNRLPVVPIAKLNSETDPQTGDDPESIYCIDFTKFIPFVHEGYWMEEGEPIPGGVTQHTTWTVFLDGQHQNLCTNVRQAGFVMHKALTS
ncbi:hypothetical protein LCGC14_0422490 [marine sediment metagenome]|uniref:Bacteriophage Mu GpT domain-containing protein n=1 Tax=marine sediment metagenome TaxID=412755 RepID=A0A0F9VCA6_9ZZZZ